MTMPNDERREGVASAVAARTVVGLFDNFAEADRAVGALREAGFPLADVSVVSRPPGARLELPPGFHIAPYADTGSHSNALA